MKTTIQHTCKCCDHEFEITVYPGTPAQTYGPPENCYPEEPPEFEPSECPKCEEIPDEETIYDHAADNQIAAEEEYWEYVMDSRRDQMELYS